VASTAAATLGGPASNARKQGEQEETKEQETKAVTRCWKKSSRYTARDEAGNSDKRSSYIAAKKKKKQLHRQAGMRTVQVGR
jgi:hypothetical protein